MTQLTRRQHAKRIIRIRRASTVNESESEVHSGPGPRIHDAASLQSLSPVERTEAVRDLQQTHGNQKVQRVLVGQRVSSRPAVQRSRIDRKPPDAVSSVGGRTGDVSFLPGTAVDRNQTLAPGEVGFTRALMQQLPDRAGETFAFYKDAHLKTVTPDFTVLDKRTREEAGRLRKAQDELDSWGHIPSSQKNWEEAVAGSTKRLKAYTDNRAEEAKICEDFNTGVPRANLVFASLAKLEAMQQMLGVKSPAEMSKALVASLKEAAPIKDEISHKGTSGQYQALKKAEEVSHSAKELTDEQRAMSAAWRGIQNLAVLDRAKEVNAEGDEARKRKGEIDKNIALVKKFGTTIDVSMAVMGVGLTGKTDGGGLLGAVEGKGSKSFTKDSITGEIEPTGGGVPGGLKETQAAVTSSLGISIPTSAGDLLETAAKIYHFSELKKLEETLKTLQNEVNANMATAEDIKVAQAVELFRAAVGRYRTKSEELQKRMDDRREAYLTLGKQLDEAAARDSKFQKSAPGKGQERFATVLALTAGVREVLAVAQGARDGFGGGSMGLAIKLVQMRDIVGLSDEEEAPLIRIHSQLLNFEANVDGISSALGSVESEAAKLLGAF